METTVAANPYELERGKPMPTLTHGAIQANLGFELKLNYGAAYRIASEVALATVPEGTTPDVVLYPARVLNFTNEPARQTDAPLLTVEIQSPSQTVEEMVEKTSGTLRSAYDPAGWFSRPSKALPCTRLPACSTSSTATRCSRTRT
jgi:hypothetical protein